MKARYNDLIYEPEAEEIKPVEIKQERDLSPGGSAILPQSGELQRSEIKPQHIEEVKPEVHDEPQIQSKPQQIKRGNWRSQLMNSNFYIV